MYLSFGQYRKAVETLSLTRRPDCAALFTLACQQCGVLQLERHPGGEAPAAAAAADPALQKLDSKVEEKVFAAYAVYLSSIGARDVARQFESRPRAGSK